MFEDSAEISEEIEEVRELLYNLLKGYPTGTTSSFLEEQYDKRYVQSGIASPLPRDWLRYIKMADEFEVKQLSSVTMVYIVNVEQSGELLDPNESSSIAIDEVVVPSISNAVPIAKSDINEKEAIDMKANDENDNKGVEGFALSSKLDPMALPSLPKVGISADVQVVSAFDPSAVYVRLSMWDPVPDYLYSALSRIEKDDSEKPTDIVAGSLYAAKIGGCWERVQVVRRSSTNGVNGYWVVFAVDLGCYHVANKGDLRVLSVEVEAFKKVFLVRCQIYGIRPDDGQSNGTTTNHQTSFWPRASQQAVEKLLNNCNSSATKFIPSKEWSYDSQGYPTTSGQLIVKGEEVGQTLVGMHLACFT